MGAFTIKVADVTFSVECTLEETRDFFAQFLCVDDVCQEHIRITSADIEEFGRHVPSFTAEACERGVLKYRLDKALVGYGAYPVHASAVAYKGSAYVFTALSGVGKSTHARMWHESLGDEVVTINDDRPYIKVEDGRAIAYSHPQSGKHGLYTNTSAPIGAIGRIVRDTSNFVVPVSGSSFFPYLVQQAFTLDEPRLTARVIQLIKKTLAVVETYDIRCNMDPGAGRAIYEQIKGGVE